MMQAPAIASFGQLPMSRALAETLARGSERAAMANAPEVSMEFLLDALCDDPDAAPILIACNIDRGQLRAEIHGYIARSRAEGSWNGELVVSDAVKRILEAAAVAATGGRRREISGAIVLAAIVGDGRSVAAEILQAHGLTFEEAIHALQTQRPGSQPALPPAPISPALSADDVLATARERVQSRAAPSLRDIMREIPRTAPPAPPLPSTQPPDASYGGLPPMAETAMPPPYPAPLNAPAPSGRQTQPINELPVLDDIRAAIGGVRHAPLERTHQPPHRSVTAPADYGDQQLGPAGPLPPNWPPVSSDERAGPVGWARPDMPGPPPIPSRAEPSFVPRGAAPPDYGSRHPGPPFAPPMPPAAGWQNEAPRHPAYPSPPPNGAMGDPHRAPQLSTRSLESPRAKPAKAQRARGGDRRGASALQPGQLVENIPRSMRAGVTSRVELRIAKSGVRTLSDGMQGGGAAHLHDIQVTRAMAARIRAPDGGFFVESASPETQWIEAQPSLNSDDFASWRFLITPQRRGRMRLQIVISARSVGPDGLNAETAMPDQIIDVKVASNAGIALRRWGGWAVAAIAGGIFARFGDGFVTVVANAAQRMLQ